MIVDPATASDATATAASPPIATATSLAALPADERPRERLLRSDGGALTDAELLAVLLRTGRPGCSVVTMAHELLRESGGLDGLVSATATELRRKGLGPAKAATLLAAFEIGRRLARGRIDSRRPLDRPGVVADYLRLNYGHRDHEVMGALYLDRRQRLLCDREIFRGTQTRAAVEPRAILKEALVRSAASFVLFHNHPSGDPSPSVEDIEFTRRMAEAGDVVGVLLVDHIILGAGESWVSLRRRGAW